MEGFNPEHGGSDVDQQLENDNGGFVANFAATHHKADPGLVMGYYDGGELPVYDHLARNYCVCDHWFSSVPGATWPNRLFSITGGAIDREDAKPPIYADHPPSDIRPGQELVLMIYRALISNQRAWERTLFIITYDEHGGLYDHVPPPMRPQDKAPFNRLGVRVPALILSPWATQGVCKQQFDHTSIIKTILTRFCQVDGKIPDVELRTTEAADLGYALTAPAPQPTPSIDEMAEAVAGWQRSYGGKPALGAPLRSPETLDEFRSGIVTASRHLRRRGLQDRRP